MKDVKMLSYSKSRILIIATAFILLNGCSNTPTTSEENLPTLSHQAEPVQVEAEQKEEALFEVFNQWRGVPYQLGGKTKDGIDCSAFVQIAFRDAWQQHLPRTTYSQSRLGAKIGYAQAQYGDLVFFKTAPQTRHVGVYIGNKRFMHASTSQGVMISRLDNPYWASTFWQFRRVEAAPQVN